MAPRRRCPTCGSKQWHKEPSSGLIACSEGHILQDYRNETTEMQDIGPHAMKKRTLKSGRRKKGKGSRADPKLYHGARGRYHYFLCLQLILRKQIAALTKLWDLPPEFEVVCKDLWALHLSLLPDPPPAEPYHHAQENKEGRDGDEAAGSRKDPTMKEEPSPQTDDDSSSDEKGGERDDQEPETDNTEEEEEDSELEALMRENSEISSSSDEDGDGMHKPTPTKKGNTQGRFAYESPVSTIAVLVVACWTMRIPVLYRDFTRVIESYELPYLDPVRILPASLVQHLTKHNIQALSPSHAPMTMSMHSLASRFAKKLYARYGVYTPETNAASMLWRITKDMGGTPVLYMLAKRVASALSVPLTLHSSLAPGLERTKAKDALQHQYDNAPPEVSLLVCIMIVLKMVYGLDGEKRGPKHVDDVACAMAGEKDFMEVLEMLNESDAKSKEVMFDSRNILHVGDMKEERLDEYISFCEKILLGQGKIRAVDGDGGLERYFPVLPKEEETGRGPDRSGGQRGVVGGDVIGSGLGVGEEYKIWNGRDVHGTPAGEYGLVLWRGAGVVGVCSEYIACVLEKHERRLMNK